LKYQLIYEPEARQDLFDLYWYIAQGGHPERAFAYIARLEAYCDSLAVFPSRGNQVNDVREGLRRVGFERLVSVAFSVVGDTVRILRILYGGRQFSEQDAEGK